MRISDWSSDVCSSDLTARPTRAASTERLRTPRPRRSRTKASRSPGCPGCRRKTPDRSLRILRPHRQHHVVDVEVARRQPPGIGQRVIGDARTEEHTSELQSLMRISYDVFFLNKNNYI